MKGKKFIIFVLPVILLFAFSALEYFDLFEPFEHRIYDAWLHVKPSVPEREDLLFLDVDDLAINKIGVWPWSREVMARGLLQIREFGALMTVFDIEYTEQSPLAVNAEFLEAELPLAFQQEFTQINAGMTDLFGAVAAGQLSIDDAMEFLPDLEGMSFEAQDELLGRVNEVVKNNDLLLANGAAANDAAYFTINLLEEPDPEMDQGRLDFAAAQRSIRNIDARPGNHITSHAGLRPAILPILQGGKGAGFPNVVVDNDGVRRRIQLIREYSGAYYGQLVFAPLLDWLQNPDVIATRDAIILEGAILPGAEAAQTIRIPLAEDGTVLINWPKKTFEESFRHISYYRLVDHDQLYEDLVYNLSLMEDSNYTAYHEGDRDFMQAALYIDQLKDAALHQGDPTAIDEIREVREYFLTEAGAFINGGAEDALRDEIAFALEDPNLSDDMAAFLRELQSDLGPVFQSTRDVYDALIESREVLFKELGDSFVIIGYTGTSTTDIGVNPFNKEYPNTGTHLAIVNTILQRLFLDDIPVWIAIAAALVLTALFVLLSWKREPTTVLIIGAVGIVIVVGTSVALFVFARLYLPIVAPVATLLLAAVAQAVVKYIEVGKEKAYIRNAFNHYLSADVISQIMDDPSKLELGGEKKMLTAMFTDVKGFSTISEALDPQDLVRLLNRYLSEMSDIVLQAQGTIDKYEGDAIISFFGAPIEFKDHAVRACRSAIRMKKIENYLNDHFLENQLSPGPLNTRIGINTGDMIVGNMGTQNRMDYTIMGHSVNLAARLEGVNKQYGTWILASEMAFEKTGDAFLGRKLDRVRVVGVSEPIRLYEVMDESELAPEASKQLAEEFDNARELFENQEFSEAMSVLKRLRSDFPDDGPTVTYRDRCSKFMRNPPPKNWDGVFNMTRK